MLVINRLQVCMLLLIIPIGGVYWYIESRDVSLGTIFFPGTLVMHIGEVPVRIEIADSEEERIQGLSGRENIEDVDGVLFIFEEAGYPALWMKDMQFSIDMIWIGEDLKVVSIDKNVSPDTYPRSFRPARPAKYVVETNVHYADTYGISVGSTVRLPSEHIAN